MDLYKLQSKRILFISVQTFNYEKAIADKLRSFGAIVDYYDERPTNSILAKGIIRIKRSFYQTKINSYYKSILKKIEGITYDYVFIIKAEVVPEFFLKSLKKNNPDCLFILYTWDSFNNNPNAVSVLKYFDKKFTFDNLDAVKYNLNFRPLFFIDEYEKLKTLKTNDFKYSVLFLGTAHSDRYLISKTVADWCTQNKLTSFAYYYMPSKLVFYFKLLFDKSFKKFDLKKINTEVLNIGDIISLYEQSLVVLDINHPGQNGLTMRTFESLGAGKKLVTTNSEIIKYPFYNKNNIFVIDRDNVKLDLSFFQLAFVPIEENLYESMSISGWLKEIFIDNTSEIWIKELNLSNNKKQ